MILSGNAKYKINLDRQIRANKSHWRQKYRIVKQNLIRRWSILGIYATKMSFPSSLEHGTYYSSMTTNPDYEAKKASKDTSSWVRTVGTVLKVVDKDFFQSFSS